MKVQWREGTAGERGLRLDAVRNQERIVVAAAGAFSELGAEVTLEEVARRAGVGVATVYRRFRNRDQLVRAVVAHVLTAEIEPVAEIETDDPWRDLAATLEASVAAVAAHSEVVALAHAAGAIDVDVVDRYLHRLDRVLTRARAAGLVRPELEPRDLAVAVMMVLATVRKVDRDGCGDERRRVAALPGVAAGRHAAGAAPAARFAGHPSRRPGVGQDQHGRSVGPERRAQLIVEGGGAAPVVDLDVRGRRGRADPHRGDVGVERRELAGVPGDPRRCSRSRSVGASVRTHTSRTGSPPSAAPNAAQAAGSWIWVVNGPDSSTGQPRSRISRAVAAIPAYSCTLTCRSYQGPSRSPGGRPAAASVAATNPPYIVSLSSSAGTGDSRASSRSATVDLPAPGGPATTHAVARSFTARQ